ncbi:MAG: 4Fe-4S dicluster domain-containing protein [Gemmatimonadota bacterium]
MAKKEIDTILWIDGELCKGTEGCGLCIDVCREDVLGIAQSLSVRGVHTVEILNPERCTSCELCMLHCPDLAIGLSHATA